MQSFHDKDKGPYAVFNANGARQCYHLQRKDLENG